MAGVPIDDANSLKIARQLGAQGKPLPAAMAGDPQLQAAYDAGAGRTPAAAAAPARPARATPRAGRPTPAAQAAPAAPAPSRPRRAWTAASASRPATYAGGAFNPQAGLARATRPAARLTTAGDGGGLFLALVLYPVTLATFKYGPSGPLIWFKAKFLNKTTQVTDSTPSGGSAAKSTTGSSKGATSTLPVRGKPVPQ